MSRTKKAMKVKIVRRNKPSSPKVIVQPSVSAEIPKDIGVVMAHNPVNVPERTVVPPPIPATDWNDLPGYVLSKFVNHEAGTTMTSTLNVGHSLEVSYSWNNGPNSEGTVTASISIGVNAEVNGELLAVNAVLKNGSATYVVNGKFDHAAMEMAQNAKAMYEYILNKIALESQG